MLIYMLLSLHPDQALPTTNFFYKLSNSSYDAAMLLFKPDPSSAPYRPEHTSDSVLSNRMPAVSLLLLRSFEYIRLRWRFFTSADMAGFKSSPLVSPDRKTNNPSEQTPPYEGDAAI